LEGIRDPCRSDAACGWLIAQLQLLDNQGFAHEQVQPFAQSSVQRPTWYLQFPGRLTDGFSQASLERMADLFDLLVEHNLTCTSKLFVNTPYRQTFVKPGLDGLLIWRMISVNSQLVGFVSLHRN
jgi:hypothetical protein